MINWNCAFCLLCFFFIVRTATAHGDTSKVNALPQQERVEYYEQHEREHHDQINQQRLIIYISVGASSIILALGGLLYKQYRQKQKINILLSVKNKEITDSINYARRIQNAILPPVEALTATFPDSFILYKPKDIVSGDFYWIAENENDVLIAAVDCTGHGVPGAFMSIVGYKLLNQIVVDKGIVQPDLVLNELSKGISEFFRKNQPETKDGMDISLCKINKHNHQLQFAGALHSLYLFHKNQFHEVKGNKIHIGDYNESNRYTHHSFDLTAGSSFYLFTDGYADQFGGLDGKKFKYKMFQQLLGSLQSRSMKEQSEILDETIEDWRGDLEQVDDIMVIGVRM
jgi:serine phosphatase RsbU (regulator of sigma subunit)